MFKSNFYHVIVKENECRIIKWKKEEKIGQRAKAECWSTWSFCVAGSIVAKEISGNDGASDWRQS